MPTRVTQGTMVTAFGEVKRIVAWSRDSRCRVALQTLLARLSRGWDPELSITQLPGGFGGHARGRPASPTTYDAFGQSKTLAGWVSDPRCKVTRPTLERSVRDGIPMAEALTYRRSPGKRNPDAGPDLDAITNPAEVVRLLASGGELFAAAREEGRRISLLVRNERHSVAAECLETLLADGRLVASDRFGVIVEYRLVK